MVGKAFAFFDAHDHRVAEAGARGDFIEGKFLTQTLLADQFNDPPHNRFALGSFRHRNSMDSQSPEQIIPGAIQSLSQLGEHRNGGGFGTALDLLKITSAQVGFFRQRLLRQTGCHAQAIDVPPKNLAGSRTHPRSLAGSAISVSAL